MTTRAPAPTLAPDILGPTKLAVCTVEPRTEPHAFTEEITMIAIEWLRTLDERKSGYRDLLDQEGDLPRAAWRLARARNQASNSFADLPSRREIAAAASAIARRLGVCSPEAKTLAEDCEAYGLPVL